MIRKQKVVLGFLMALAGVIGLSVSVANLFAQQNDPDVVKACQNEKQALIDTGPVTSHSDPNYYQSVLSDYNTNCGNITGELVNSDNGAVPVPNNK